MKEMLSEYLRSNYKDGEPIFLSDVHIEGMSEENTRYHFKKLTDDGVLYRFGPGVYFFPKENMLGVKPFITTDEVIRSKYISRNGKRVGFYSGFTLANRMHLTTQVPFTVEITSNFSPAPVRKITLNQRRFILRRPLIPVTDENVHVMEFLDCLRDLEKYADEDYETCGESLSEFAKAHHIKKSDLTKYIGQYPLKVYKAIFDTGVNYVSA